MRLPAPRFSQRLAYALVGLFLSAGAPAGLAIVRLGAGIASPRSLAEEWAQAWITYLYVAVSTAAVFTAFGGVLGAKADQLAQLATVDRLTGLLNRHGLAERLETELRRAQRYGQPLSILLIDLDHLKEINDRQGHDAGDDALCRVGTAIHSGGRATDIAGRWGGDEFLLLAASTPPDDARLLGERIRRSVNVIGSGTPLSVSIGIASTASPHTGSPDDLLRRADTALYTAKRRGRNQVASDADIG